MATKCPQCEFENKDDSKFCKECGTQLIPLEAQQTSETLTSDTLTQGITRGTLFAERYEIIEELGRGGMGIVFKAKDTKLVRTVALKFLPPEWAYNVQAKERFVREARAAAALDHPHICSLFEMDEAEGRMFISMAFVEGESLKEKIEHGCLKVKQVVDIGIQLAAGLKDAHLKGIVHRDIKCSNIMISEEGQAKILDFGLAKVSGATLVTNQRTRMGTVAYMSPEQARGEAVDLRTDIWSLGVVLYKSLTGHLPFRGEHDQVVIHSLLHQEPKPMRSQRPDIPVALERIVDRALRKKREERYQNADELLADLAWLKKELEAGSFEESLSWFRILLKKRIPQYLGLYFLASLGVLQLVKWLVNHFLLSPHLPNFSLTALLSFIPTILLLVSLHGRSGHKKWAKTKKIGIAANLVASAALLVFLFHGKSMGAATTTVTLKNEEGQTFERIIPKGDFLKSFTIFNFENKSNDASQDWLQYAVPFLLKIDLSQDLFVQPEPVYNFYYTMEKAGFPEGVGLPLPLKRKIAREMRKKYFVSGSFSLEGEEVSLEVSIYETKRASVVTKRDFKGRDIFKLVDNVSLTIRRDLGIPERHIKDTKDLPISEITTASTQALQSYIASEHAFFLENSWDKAIREIERSVIEDRTFAHAYFSMTSLYGLSNQVEKQEHAYESVLQYLYKLPERIQFLIKSDYYAFNDDPEKQLAVVKMMVELNPYDILGHQMLARIYSETRKEWEALAEYHRILELDPENHAALRSVGWYYKLNGNFKKALKYYKRYASGYPDNVDSYTLIGDLYRTIGDFERAKSYHSKALLIEPENVIISCNLATLEYQQGNFERAEAMYLNALATSRDLGQKRTVHTYLSSFYAYHYQYRKALEYARLSLEGLGKNMPPSFVIEAKMGDFEIYLRAGQKDEAFKMLEDFISKVRPSYNRVWPLGYVVYFLELEEADRAAGALKEVEVSFQGREFDDLRANIIELRGRVHELRGEYEQALIEYEKSLKSRPAYYFSWDIHESIGRCYRKLNEYKKAEKHLQKQLTMHPFDPEIHYELALVYIDKKNKKKALEHMNIALGVWKNADPGIPKVEDARKRLAGLKSS